MKLVRYIRFLWSKVHSQWWVDEGSKVFTIFSFELWIHGVAITIGRHEFKLLFNIKKQFYDDRES